MRSFSCSLGVKCIVNFRSHGAGPRRLWSVPVELIYEVPLNPAWAYHVSFIDCVQESTSCPTWGGLDVMADDVEYRGDSDGVPAFIGWTLRGVGQVVFQNNPVSGAVILGGLYYNSWIYGTVCLVGTAVGTLTALLLKADRELIKNGLFGFNGALVAIGLVAFSSKDFAHGTPPTALLWLYLVVAAALTSVVVSVFMTLLGPHKVTGLTMPFILVGWMFLAGALHFSMLEVGPAIKPTSPSDFTGPRPAYTVGTFYHGSINGLAEIFFQDNLMSGIVILIGIAINSRISA